MPEMAKIRGILAISGKMAKISHFRAFSGKTSPFSLNTRTRNARNDPKLTLQNPNKKPVDEKVVRYFITF